MRPYLEHVSRPEGASWRMLNRRLENGIPFQWHHHPEMELTLTLNSRGQRFIGNHVGTYDHGDLVLIGPNLAHTWASRERIDPAQPHVALVLWFRMDWVEALASEAVEFAPVLSLLQRASSGLAFDTALGLELAPQFEAMESLEPLHRLTALMAILDRVARAEGGTRLSTTAPSRTEEGRLRIDRVLLHMHQNYHRPLHLDELAEIAALSLSGLHRMFLRHTGVRISDYLIRLRIGEACSLLSSTQKPVQFIASEVGYSSAANFNRQFKRLRGMSPRTYRAQFC